MKTNISFVFQAAAACLLLAACQRDEATHRPPTTPNTIQFEIAIPATRTETGADFKSAWTAGDRIGIFAAPAGEPLQSSDNPLQNVALSFDGTSWTGDAVWPDGCAALDFYAYYPYDEAAEDPCAIDFAVMTDQRGMTGELSNYALSDLMTAQTKDVQEGATVSLQFSHVLSMIQVSVPASPYKSMGPDETLMAYLSGVRPRATLDLNNGVTLDETAEPVAVTMYRVATERGEAHTFRALLPAQTIDSKSGLFTFEHSARQLFRDEPTDAPVETVAGRAETFERTLPDNLYQTVLCKAGSFKMGANENNLWDAKIHMVTLTRPFHITRYEITNIQFATFLNDAGVGEDGKLATGLYPDQKLIEPYARGLAWTAEEGWQPAEGYADYPACNVSWYGADEFARWAGGALPTDAQWEYACRAGSDSNYYFGANGSDLTNYAWYSENNQSGGAHEVGLKLPNNWGLYDATGNVAEWVSDWLYYDEGAQTDPEHSVDPDGYRKVKRGGHYASTPLDCYSAISGISSPDTCEPSIGFRIIFPI